MTHMYRKRTAFVLSTLRLAALLHLPPESRSVILQAQTTVTIAIAYQQHLEGEGGIDILQFTKSRHTKPLASSYREAKDERLFGVGEGSINCSEQVFQVKMVL